MTMTDPALASPLQDLHDGLTRALEEEDDRFARVVAEHDLIRASILKARDNIEEAINATDAAFVARPASSSNGNGVVGTVVVDLRDEGVPVVEPTDTVVDPTTATVKEFIRAVMATRRGEIWRAEEVLERMKGIGYSGGSNDISRLGTIRATLGQMVKSGELNRPEPGDFILPRK